MASLFHDLKRVIGNLGRRPGTSAAIILTLALVIGANAAIFSLFNALVLRTLPVPQPEQLVDLQTTIPDNVNGDEPFSLSMFQELSRNQSALVDLFAVNPGNINNLEADGNRFTAGVSNVSGNFYKAMRIAPLLGRFIEPADVALDHGTSTAIAVISYRAWRGWFHGQPDVIGKTLRIGAHSYTIIGVEPEGFSGLIIDGSSDVTIPIFAPGTYVARDGHTLWLDIWGRLRPGSTLAQARANLQTLWPSVQKLSIPSEYEGVRSKRFFARRLKVQSASNGNSFLRNRFSHSLSILLGFVMFLLLIASLNLANLSIAKMAAEQHAWSIKLALGASRWHLLCPVLVESLVVSLTGAAFGLALAFWIGPLLVHTAWTGLVQTPLNASPDLRVLAFTAAAAVATALLFAVVPAWFATRAEAASGLRQNTRSVHQGSTWLGKLLLTAQVGLSLVLIVGALLFAKTLLRLRTVDTGYKRDHMLTMLLFPQPGAAKWSNRRAYYQELAEKVKSIPGVSSVSYSNGGPASQFEYRLPMSRSPESNAVQAIDEAVGPDFFSTMGMRVMAGREFNWSDDEGSQQVAVVSRKLADQLYGAMNPIGQDLYWGVRSNQQKLRVVGVVNNASLWKVESVEPMAVYRPIMQLSDYNEPLMDIRTAIDPAALKTAAEQAVRTLGRHYSLRTATLEERLDAFITAQRLTAFLTSFFGIVGLLIAAIGLYGLMSFHVMQRTAELAVRLAVGAQNWQIFSVVLREVLLVAGLGCALGLAAIEALRSYISSILFGVSATDPALLGAASLSLVLVAVAAGFIPARRAAFIDPAITLRKD